MATNSSFIPIVEASVPGTPITEKAQIVEHPNITEGDSIDNPEIAKAGRVSPEIMSALTGE